MRVTGTLNSKDNLCNYCQLSIATCPKANHLKFGDGFGNDNVVECSEFIVKSIHGTYPIEGKPEYGVIPKAAPVQQTTPQSFKPEDRPA